MLNFKKYNTRIKKFGGKIIHVLYQKTNGGKFFIHLADDKSAKLNSQ